MVQEKKHSTGRTCMLPRRRGEGTNSFVEIQLVREHRFISWFVSNFEGGY